MMTKLEKKIDKVIQREYDIDELAEEMRDSILDSMNYADLPEIESDEEYDALYREVMKRIGQKLMEDCE